MDLSDRNRARRLTRRSLLLASTSLGTAVACRSGEVRPSAEPARKAAQAEQTSQPRVDTGAAVLDVFPLSASPWKTFDPFLFCVHHDDAYPRGNEQMGPVASLDGRHIGSDFGGKDGWSMYHGDEVPGFPRHPHRGFETITVTRRGFIDHSDSLGATARYGQGDVQWMTAGSGIVHAEMFPLLHREQSNPTELFQIWINLPKVSKFVTPHFSMMWNSSIPTRSFKDTLGRNTKVTVVAGKLSDATAPKPPPDSWAANAKSDVAIWSVKLDPNASWQLPAARPGTDRTLYYFSGKGLSVDTREIQPKVGVRVRVERPTMLINGSGPSEVLVLQGRPIGEPIAKRGPFVMNTDDEIRQAFADYRRTGFGGWPWGDTDPVHARTEGRFAIHANGREERGT